MRVSSVSRREAGIRAAELGYADGEARGGGGDEEPRIVVADRKSVV